MSKNIDNLYIASIGSCESKFLEIILNLSKEEIETINFELLDRNVEDNINFSIRTKVLYDKILDRNTFENAFKNIVSNPFSYRYSDLMYLAKKMPNLRKQLLDILCVSLYDDERCNRFVEDLQSSNLYKNYMNSIVNGNDEFLKIHIALYFGYLDTLFSDHLELAKKIIENDEFSMFHSCRSDHLLRLSKFSKNKEALYYIKDNLIGVIEQEESKILDDIDDNFLSLLGITDDDKKKTMKLKIDYAMETFNKNTRGLID